MRRLSSIVLLALLGLLFASPLLALATKSETSLHACCRRNGSHHCLEASNEAAGASTNPSFNAPVEKCPWLPATFTAVHSDTFAPAANQAIYAGLSSHPAVVAQTESKFRISRSRSRQKRGPPASISL